MKIQVLVGPILALSLAAGPGWSLWIDPTPIQVNSGSEQHGQRVVPVDFEGDEDIDLVCAYSLSDEVVLELNDGDGSSWQRVSVGTGIVAMFALAANFDVKLADTDLDIAAVGLFDRDLGFPSLGVVVWYEQGATLTSWTEHVIDDTLVSARYLDVGDIDGDGDPDLVVASAGDDGTNFGNAVVWYENRLDQSLPWQRWIIVQPSPPDFSDFDNPESVRLVDIDGGAGLEVVVAEYGFDRLAWYESGNAPRQNDWTRHTIAEGEGAPTSARPYDMDGDGDEDFLTTNKSSWEVLWYEQPDDPVNDAWPRHVVSDTFAEPVEAVRGDFDNDGRLDIAAGGVDWSTQAGEIAYFIDDGLGSYTDHVFNYFSMTSVEGADIDGDLDLDAISASYEGHSVNWWPVLGIFQDGFETGDLSAWSSSSP